MDHPTARIQIGVTAQAQRLPRVSNIGSGRLPYMWRWN
jgi:hypothetical protein